MVKSIREVLKISSSEEFLAAVLLFDEELDGILPPLYEKLDKNISSGDISNMEIHMGYVESWRARVVRWLSLAVAFEEHGESAVFLQDKQKGVSVESYRKTFSAGGKALVSQLDGLVRCIDSRVNQCKKLLGLEGDGYRSSTSPSRRVG